ncbi:MAG: N-acetyltransferase [Bacteroidaceae bacterium]|nr:N-acetyltransferase [Bacteroidaceae bacterium]
MIIRPATPKDAEALQAIYSYYVNCTAVSFEYDAPTVEEFKRRVKDISLSYPYLVAEDSVAGRIIGYAYASPLSERKAYLLAACSSIYLDRTQRHKGLGTLLEEALEEKLRVRGIRNLYACIATAAQPDEYLTFDSQNFHRRMGFVEVGHFHECGLKFGKWYDVLWMEKKLIK